MTQKDQIAILMQEYGTLRAEVIMRTTIGFQLIAVIVALLSLLLNSNTEQRWKGILAPTSAIVIGTAIYFIFDGITRLAARLRELEKEVNKRAGEELLKWETRYAIMRFGELRRQIYRPQGRH